MYIGSLRPMCATDGVGEILRRSAEQKQRAIEQRPHHSLGRCNHEPRQT
jgi:hypothetical protein